MRVVAIVFVLLLLLLTGAFIPVIVFSGWVLLVVLGLVIVGWIFWRVVSSELFIILIVVAGG
jgi:hypothetical protein